MGNESRDNFVIQAEAADTYKLDSLAGFCILIKTLLNVKVHYKRRGPALGMMVRGFTSKWRLQQVTEKMS